MIASDGGQGTGFKNLTDSEASSGLQVPCQCRVDSDRHGERLKDVVVPVRVVRTRITMIMTCQSHATPGVTRSGLGCRMSNDSDSWACPLMLTDQCDFKFWAPRRPLRHPSLYNSKTACGAFLSESANLDERKKRRVALRA